MQRPRFKGSIAYLEPLALGVTVGVNHQAVQDMHSAKGDLTLKAADYFPGAARTLMYENDIVAESQDWKR
jgi:hypothetical protein